MLEAFTSKTNLVMIFWGWKEDLISTQQVWIGRDQWKEMPTKVSIQKQTAPVCSSDSAVVDGHPLVSWHYDIHHSFQDASLTLTKKTPVWACEWKVSSSKLPKFRKCTYTMNPSYSRPVSLDPLFSQPDSLCVTCFTPLKWLVAMGRPFSSIWKLFGTMSMPCAVPEMLWTLDELKRVLISEFPILETEEGDGFKILFDLFVEWAETLLSLQQPASARSVEFGELWPRILLSGDFRPRILMSHRTRGVSSHHRGPHRTPHTYSQIIVPHKRDRTPEKLAQTAKNIFFEKLTWRVFFIFFPLRR